MKRPLAGLLATAAAVPGAWLLASSDEGQLPSPDPIDPDSADAVQPKPDPAAMLATIEPSFGRVVDLPTPAEAVPATVADLTAPTESAQRETPSAEPDPIAEPAPPVLAVQTPPAPQPAFTAQPLIQPLPSVPLAAKQDKVVAQPPEPAQAKLAAAEPAPKPIPPMRDDLAFTAKPVIHPLPQPVIVAQTEPTPAPPPAVVSPQIPTKSLVQSEPLVQPTKPKTPLRPGPVLATKNVPIPAAQFDERPVLKSQLAGREVPNRLPVSQAVNQPLTTEKLPVVAPVKLERPAPLAKAPAMAAAKPPVANSQPVAMAPAPAVQPAMVAPPAPPRLATAQKPPAVTVASKPQVVTPPAPAPVAIKRPVGEVVLAAYSPAPSLATVSPVKPRQNLVETTAAKTVPIGAPERVTYPEPAFGPPEAKFIPAALSSVEPPEQPAAIGSASTLAQAIAYSYETNPRLLAERASTRSADLGYPAARAAFGPRLDASASLSYTRDRDEILPGSFLRQQGWSDTASLILSQPLLTFGRSQARVGQAAANVDFRRESLRLVQNEVMLDVIGAYVGTLREAGAVTIARENVALLQRQLEESNARFAVREITLADVQQVETRLALGKTVLLDAQARLGEIQSRFYRAVGMPPGELAPPEPLTLPVNSLPEAYSLADNESPLVRAAQARERISRALLAGTRAESAPRVDFRGSADYGSMSDYSRDLRGTRVRGTVTLSVPLFDSGARSAESGQAREANSADLQLIAAAQRDSRTAVATGWNNVLAARLSIDHYRQAVESAQRAYENAQRQERAGMRTTLDVLDLARDLLNVRNAYNAALAEEYQARATLLATMGQLDPAKMSDGIKLYDPADHFRKVRGKGDIPLLTGTLAALDGVVLPNLKANKPSPDAAALVGTAETVTGEWSQ